MIGRAAAVANIFGFHVSGWPAWILWLFIHLMYLVQFQSRILVFIQWGFQYLTFSRGARLITGKADSDLSPVKGVASAAPLSHQSKASRRRPDRKCVSGRLFASHP